MRKAPLLAIALAAGLTSCSFGAKQSMTSAISAAAANAARAGSATGQLSVTVKAVKGRNPPPPGPPRITPTAVTGIPVALDLSHDQAAVGLVDPHDPATAQLLFTPDWVYERRASHVNLGPLAATNLVALAVAIAGPPPPVTGSTLASGSVGARPTAQRPWLQLDFSRLPRKDQNRAAGSLGINPDFLVTLLKGTLTGSVTRAGTESIGDIPVTHYRMNVGRDKAERGLPDKTRTTLDRIFRANAIGGLVFHAEVWIDGQGLPRRVLVRFRQSLGSDSRADLSAQLDLTSFGTPVTVTVPTRKQVATVTSFGQLVHSAVGA